MFKAIFFDRDGVVNKSILTKKRQRPPWSKDEIVINEDFINLKKEYSKKYKIFIVSNQPDFIRGNISKQILLNVNSEIIKKVEPDDFQVDYSDDPRYKKPSPYMLMHLIKKYNIDVKKSWMIGDRWSDIKSGELAGCKTILIKNKFSYSKNNDDVFVRINPDYTVKTLKDIYKIIK